MIGIRMNDLKTVCIISFRGFRSTLYGVGLYIVTAIGCILATVVIRVYLGATIENGLLIMTNPLTLPLNLGVSIAAIYLAFAGTVTVAGERDSGTLEVLFCGPVNAGTLITAKWLEQVLSYFVIISLYAIVFTILAAATGFGMSDLCLALLLTIPLVSCIIAFGILVSTMANKTRTSILVLCAVFTVLLTAQWLEASTTLMTPALSFASSVLAIATRIIGYFSPFAWLNRGLKALAICDLIGYSCCFLFSIGYTAILLVLSARVLDWKEARG